MRCTAIVGALGVAAIAACKDSNVPFFTAPTSVPSTPQGIDQAVTGMFSGTRLDMGTFVLNMAGYGRQAGNYTNTEPRFITYDLGVIPTVPPTGATGGVWGFEYTNILQGHQILATLPNVAPAYTAAQVAAITGMVQTIEAFNYMIVAEIHDTLGMEIQGATTATVPAQVCVKDGWAYIVALLDSGNANRFPWSCRRDSEQWAGRPVRVPQPDRSLHSTARSPARPGSSWPTPSHAAPPGPLPRQRRPEHRTWRR